MKQMPIERRLEDLLRRIAELQNLIAEAQPKTLVGAAVLLRRALAAIEAHDCHVPLREPERVEERLVAAALRVMESYVVAKINGDRRLARYGIRLLW